MNEKVHNILPTPSQQMKSTASASTQEALQDPITPNIHQPNPQSIKHTVYSHQRYKSPKSSTAIWTLLSIISAGIILDTETFLSGHKRLLIFDQNEKTTITRYASMPLFLGGGLSRCCIYYPRDEFELGWRGQHAREESWTEWNLAE